MNGWVTVLLEQVGAVERQTPLATKIQYRVVRAFYTGRIDHAEQSRKHISSRTLQLKAAPTLRLSFEYPMDSERGIKIQLEFGFLFPVIILSGKIIVFAA